MFERPTTAFQDVYEMYDDIISELESEIELIKNLIEATEANIKYLEENNFTLFAFLRGSNEDKLVKERENLTFYQGKLQKCTNQLSRTEEKKKEISTVVLKDFQPSSDQVQNPH